MYNIIDNVYLFTCIMGKLHNIAAGVMITWAILGLGKEAVSQTTGNNNGKANVGQVQDSTKKAIVDIDSLDHETIINTNIDRILRTYWEEVGRKILRNHMLIEINTIRKQNNVSDLILNENLNEASLLHSEYMYETNTLSHRGRNYSNPTKRAQEAWFKYLVLECVAYTWYARPYTIKQAVTQRTNSEWHFEAIIHPHTKTLWFGAKWFFLTTMYGGWEEEEEEKKEIDYSWDF